MQPEPSHGYSSRSITEVKFVPVFALPAEVEVMSYVLCEGI